MGPRSRPAMALPAIAGLTGRGANDDVTSCIEAVAGSRKVGQLARGPVRRPPLDQPVGSKPSTPSSPGSWSVKAPLVDSPAWWHTETTSGSASGVEFPSANPAVLAVALVGAEQRIRLVQDVKGAASTPRATTGESTSPARTWMLIGIPMICLTRARRLTRPPAMVTGTSPVGRPRRHRREWLGSLTQARPSSRASSHSSERTLG